MRILVANKFWYRRGGLERVMFDEIEWLTAAGHEVAHFSTAHPANAPSRWSGYFADYIELGSPGELSVGQRLRATARVFNNRQAAAQFDRLLADFAPDVIHVHGIHRQISPSILDVANSRAVPVVQTLHDYHHVCPADLLLYRGEEPCDPRKCGRVWTMPAIQGACVRGSVAASALSAVETVWSRGRYERAVERFICPSLFMARAMAAAGWLIPMDHVPNAAPSVVGRDGPGRGFLVAGRVAAEKGVEDALRAARQAGVSISVLGDGPLLSGLTAAYPEVAFSGHVAGSVVEEAVSAARAVVVPSHSFENASMSVLEALSAGVPVIATRVGGTPELLSDGVEGLLVPPSDVEALADAMRRLDQDEGMAIEMGRAAVRRASEFFTPAAHTEGILQCYAMAIQSRSLRT